MPRMKSIKDVCIDAVLNTMTTSATKKAAASVAGLEGYDAVESPISIRMTTRAMAFYNALSAEMNIPRSTIMQALLEHLANTAIYED